MAAAAHGRCSLALLVGLTLAASRRPDSEGAIVPHDASTATRYSLLVSYLPLKDTKSGYEKKWVGGIFWWGESVVGGSRCPSLK